MILYKKYQSGGPLSYHKDSDTYWGGTLDQTTVEGKSKKPYYTEDFDKIMKENPTDYRNDNLAALYPGRVKMIQQGQIKDRDLALANSAAEKILKKNPRKEGEDMKDWIKRLSPEEKEYVMQSQYGVQFNETILDKLDRGLKASAAESAILAGPVGLGLKTAMHHKFGTEPKDVADLASVLDYSTNIVRAVRNAFEGNAGQYSFMDYLKGVTPGASENMLQDMGLDPLNLAGEGLLAGLLSESKKFISITKKLAKAGKVTPDILRSSPEWLEAVTEVYKSNKALQAKGSLDDYLTHVSDIIGGKKPNQYGVLYKNNKGPALGSHFSASDWDRFDPKMTVARMENSYQFLGDNLHLSMKKSGGTDWKDYANNMRGGRPIKEKIWLAYTENPYIAGPGGLDNELKDYLKEFEYKTDFDYVPNKWAKGLETKFDGIVNEAGNEFTTFNPDNLHLLGSKGDINLFKTRVDKVSNGILYKNNKLPGLHLKSTMDNGAISKIVEPKTGLINTEQALAIIGKESGGPTKVNLIKEGLGNNIPKKMDYNEFRRVVQDQLIPLDHNITTNASHYGIEDIGYKQAEDLLENQTLILSNKKRFGWGSNAHNNPEETLGHIHFLRDAKTPDILTVTQLQSDAFQGPHSIMPKLFDKEASLRILDKMKDLAKKQDYDWHNAIQQPNGSWRYPGTDVIISDYLYKQGPGAQAFTNDLYKAHIDNFPQKRLLEKNHQERYLQELVDYAAKRGDINKVRVPTSETAAKVQGYKKIPKNNTGYIGEANTLAEAKKRYKDLMDEFASLKSQLVNLKIAGLSAEGDKLFHIKKAQKEVTDKLIELEKVNPMDYKESQKTILKKYSDQPKLIKKLFGKEPKIVADYKGNKWYEFDIPKSFKEGKGQIKAFSVLPPALLLSLSEYGKK